VPGVASEQARAPARRESGNDKYALGPADLRERSPTLQLELWKSQGRSGRRPQCTKGNKEIAVMIWEVLAG